MHIAIVFNPKSGKRAAVTGLSDVVTALTSRHHKLTVIDCQELRDFERELRVLAEDLDRLIVIGGDGTLNGVVNALMNSGNHGVPIAFVPTGRGKDTARSLPAWTADSICSSAFELASSFPTDLIRITLTSGAERYAINVSSVGLGAHAAAIANKLPRALGAISYIVGAARGFMPLRPFHLTMTVDGAEVEQEKALLVAACNGKAFGGGIYLAPMAGQSDGLLDLVVASNANLADLALQLGKLKSGTLFEHPALTRWQAELIELEPIDSVYFEADGEGLTDQPIRYEIAPGAINWITP